MFKCKNFAVHTWFIWVNKTCTKCLFKTNIYEQPLADEQNYMKKLQTKLSSYCIILSFFWTERIEWRSVKV